MRHVCRHRCAGLTLIDAVVSLVVLATVTVPIATGIAAMARSGLLNYREARIRAELVYEAERLRGEAFDDIPVGSATTSIALPGGAQDMTTTVALADYDGDAIADAEFKLVTVELDGRQIRFYRSDWKE